MAKKTATIGMTGTQLLTVINENDSELYSKGGGNAINIVDAGAKGDGITDDTIAIQAAIALVPDGGTLYIPQGIYMINIHNGGVEITKSMCVIFDKNAEFKAIPTHTSVSQLIYINSKSYIEIYGGKFTGDYNSRKGVDVYEQNYGIRCIDASNIYIHDCYFSQFPGDGIACYRSSGTSSNIHIDRCEFTDVRRWGIFCDIKRNLKIADCHFYDILSDITTGGGIDIEFHGVDTDINNVLITGCSFENLGNKTNSVDGAISVNGNISAINGFKFIGNNIKNCNNAIFDKVRSLIINENTIDSCPIVLRGNANRQTGTIIGNKFLNSGGIYFGNGSAEAYDVELIANVLVHGNTFKDFASLSCITAVVCRLSDSSFIDNIFDNCIVPFLIDKRYGVNNYFKGNRSNGELINTDNSVSKIRTLTESRGMTTGIPTAGTYEKGEWLNEIDFVAAGYIGLICTTKGTMDTINTVCTANGTNVVVIDNPYLNNVIIGAYVKINNGSQLQVISISGNNITMSDNVVAGVGVTFINDPATFKKFGALEP